MCKDSFKQSNCLPPLSSQSLVFPTALREYERRDKLHGAEANTFSESREFPRILRHPEAHRHTHKGRPPFPILRQINPFHCFHSTYQIFNVMFFSHLRLYLPKAFFPSRFTTKTLYTALPSPTHATCPPISLFLI